jgi:hypothetical protein
MHVEQYRRLTIDGFAKRYADHFASAWESEAEATPRRSQTVEAVALSGGDTSRSSFTQPTLSGQSVPDYGHWRQPVQRVVYTDCQAANAWRATR